MGRRWKRNGKKTEKPAGGWGSLERQDLLRYLKTYRQAIIAHNNGNGSVINFKNSFTSRIGDVDLPDLSQQEIIQAPYLQFPMDLSSKQRKAVHETSVEGM